MKFLNRIFITLMALSLASAILAFTLDATLLKASYVTNVADQSGIYNDLAKQLPKQLAGNDENAPQLQAAFERVVTPQFLQSNFDSYIGQFLDAAKSGQTLPSLDLSSIIAQAQALGVQLTPEQVSQLQQSLTIAPNSIPTQTDNGKLAQQPAPAKANPSIYRKASNAKYVFLFAAIIFGALVFVTAPHHRLRALGHGFLSTTFWLAIYWALFKLAPGIASHQLKTAKGFELASSVSKLITLGAGGVAQRILIAGIVTAAIGGGLVVLSMFMPHFGGGLEPAKAGSKENRTPLPSLFHKD